MENNKDLQLLNQIAQTGRINDTCTTNSANSSRGALQTLTEGTNCSYYELNSED